MSVFLDTSALFATFDRDDTWHAKASTAWTDFIEAEEKLTTTNYVIIETSWLIRKRSGFTELRKFHNITVPLLEVIWVDMPLHYAAVSEFLAAGQRGLSLVDCASFEAMRHYGIRTAFTFDKHFEKQGFDVIPRM